MIVMCVTLVFVSAAFGAVLGFISSQLASIADATMSYGEIFGFVRFRLVKMLEPDMVTVYMLQAPDTIPEIKEYTLPLYDDVIARHNWIKFLFCEYCLSFWILLILYSLSFWSVEMPLIYFLTGISFNNVFHKVF